MKVFLTFRIFLCILILRETCPQNLRGNVTVTDLHLISENIVPMRRVLDRGPYFDTSATKNVTSLVGITGHLNCRIKNLGNKTVSWIRHRDLHLLTVSESTYTSDQRFTSIYNKQTGDWSLQYSASAVISGGGHASSPANYTDATTVFLAALTSSTTIGTQSRVRNSIKFPQLRDSGVYECQVSTTPPVGYTMVFSVVGN
ncbi:uncharacterized protein LOC120284921 isoform X4 [Drosophila simulans]|uniref:uncharacterized protein LOC27206935 isoform X3 n=1 Tax=Drosophila simulans TaxID=7240 RepID=UPI00192CE6D7|nr:uncharacterized protein LOC27206935 isoform X3 [Drosophila simulans]XP_039150358.1 uncharacterized protein LOC120284921 isoform X4 [Drosophila simulans]